MLETANTFLKHPKKPFKLLSKNGIEEPLQNIHLTPREEWLKKEKSLKIKFFIILFLTHSLWLLRNSPSKQVDPREHLKVEDGNKIIKVPSLIMTTLPPVGKKKLISIYSGKKLIIKKAFLWSTYQNSNMQEIAKLEIPSHEMSKINLLNHEDRFKVLPYVSVLQKKKTNRKLNVQKRSIREIHI